MAFTVNTLDETHDFLLALARAHLPDRDWTPLSSGWKWTRILAGAVTDNHAHIAAVLDDLLPDTAVGDALVRWANLRGLTKKGATPARKAAALRVTGTGDVAVGDQLRHEATGLLFQVNEAEAVVATADVDIVAVDVGSETRLPAGEPLVFLSAPAGIDEDAELVLDLDEDGEDEESPDALRARVINRFREPPLGGAQNDFVQWALEVTGIAAAFCYPLRQGYGSVDLAALHAGSGSSRLLSAGEISDLQDYIDERRPVAMTSFRVLTVQATDVDVDAEVLPNGEERFEFDWDDATPLVVAAWTGATRTLQFTTDRPESMDAGGRITIKPAAGGGTGEQFVIESLSGTDAVILEQAPATAPAATDTVYSGGDLVDPVRDAILEHINGLGTSNPDATQYGAWEANLRPQNLYRIAQLTEGVKASNVTNPAAKVEPADNPYPDDEIVLVLVPRRVLVRRMHL
jgi:uncharacterized phage protein gp47/JayE